MVNIKLSISNFLRRRKYRKLLLSIFHSYCECVFKTKIIVKLAITLSLVTFAVDGNAEVNIQTIEDVVMHPQRSVDGVNVSGKEQIDCSYIRDRNPIVIFAAGQSLVANTNGDYPWNRTLTRDVYEQWGALCYKANAPLYGASDARQSFVLLVAEYISRATHRDVVINMAAVGGSPISQFLNGTSNSLLTTQLHNMTQAGFTPDFVIWEHGQADLEREVGEYTQDVKKVLDIFRSRGVSSPIFIPLDTMLEWRVNEPLREEQRSIQDLDGVVEGPDIDLIRFRYDGTHLDQRGLEMQAAMWVQALDRYFRFNTTKQQSSVVATD